MHALVTSVAMVSISNHGHNSILHQPHVPVIELVSKELNHLLAILHVYAGGLNFMKLKRKFLLLFFKKIMEILLHF